MLPSFSAHRLTSKRETEKWVDRARKRKKKEEREKIELR